MKIQCYPSIKGYGLNINQLPHLKLATFLPSSLLLWSHLFSTSSQWWPPGDLWSLPSTSTRTWWTSLLASFSMALFRCMRYSSFLSSNTLAKPWVMPAVYKLLSLERPSSPVPLKAFFPASIMLLQAPNHMGPSIFWTICRLRTAAAAAPSQVWDSSLLCQRLSLKPSLTLIFSLLLWLSVCGILPFPGHLLAPALPFTHRLGFDLLKRLLWSTSQLLAHVIILETSIP